MKKVWIAVALLLLAAVAAVSLYFAFQSPAFVGGLVSLAVSAIVSEILPRILKPEDPAKREARIEAGHHNEILPSPGRKHPNEGGHR